MRQTPQLLLIAAVTADGVLHTVVPDHRVAIALIARQHGWSKRETALASFRAGLRHVISTMLIAGTVRLGGVAFASRFGRVVDTATSLALIGFGSWIAVSALSEMNLFGSSGSVHHNQHIQSNNDANHDPIHGAEQRRFATDEGELKLSIFERGSAPRFHLSGVPIDIARVETRHLDGSTQLFRFESRGTYCESTEEVPEPPEFAVSLMIDHGGHLHSFAGQFVEHGHDGGPNYDRLYEPSASQVLPGARPCSSTWLIATPCSPA